MESCGLRDEDMSGTPEFPNPGLNVGQPSLDERERGARSLKRATSFLSMSIGLTALLFGLGATLALLSYLVGRPTGPEFLFDRFSAQVTSGGVPAAIGGTLRVENRIPSMRLVGLLVAGASIGGAGIALAQKKKFPRNVRIAQIGLLSNVAGLLVWWVAILWIDWTQYH